MRWKLLLFCFALSWTFWASGAVIEPDEALSRVLTEGPKRIKGSQVSPRFRTTVKGPDGQPAIYVFTYGGEKGFMLVSADDAVAPLLAYSPTNDFPLDSLPEGPRIWMESLGGEIAAARQSGQRRVATRAQGMEEVKPLISTRWDQTYPYNSGCPIVDGRRSVTGCVATAMAQVMKFWQYPAVGKGEITYSPETMDEDLYLDFSTVSFNWSAMLNSYRGIYSDISAQAVADLMKACGHSVMMRYSPYESGAYSREITNALVNYFGYDQGVDRKKRADYSSQSEWNNLVYGELRQGRPVIYSGQSTAGAHCFVCDGYDGEGLFHINWGWSGVSDGYFLLDQLNPSTVGTGGHYGGYNMDQDVIIGITPPVGRLINASLSIDNSAPDSGNTSGWGYTYRINDFSNILLTLNVNVYGGHVSSPLYVTVYENDMETKKNGRILLETTFDEPLNHNDGKVTCSTRLRLDNVDVSKFHSVYVAYDLKGERTTIANVRLAASSGVDEVMAGSSAPIVKCNSNLIRVESDAEVSLQVYGINGVLLRDARAVNPEIDITGLGSGLYLVVATDRDGNRTTLKLNHP